MSAVETAAKGKQEKQKDKETYVSAVETAGNCPVRDEDVQKDVYMWKEIQMRDLCFESALNHTYMRARSRARSYIYESAIPI